MTNRRRCAWVVAHAFVFFLSFPQVVLGWSFDLGIAFAWLVPATMLFACEGSGWRKGALWGGLAGWLAHCFVFYWVYVAVVRYGGAGPIVGLLSIILLASYGALFSVLLGMLSGMLGKQKIVAPLVFAAGWVILDWLKSVFLTGFPWATLGYALHADVWARSLASFSGVYGLSCLAVLGGFSLKFLLEKRISLGIGYGLLVVLLHGTGFLLVGENFRGAETLRVGIVQGNIDQAVKWEPGRAERILRTYEEGTWEAVENGARLIVWPETAVPGIPERSPALLERLERLANETGTVLIVGAVGLEEDLSASGAYQFFDSALLVTREGLLRDRYDKAHLVPFGEYIPLRKFVGMLVKAFATGATDTDVTPGDGPKSLSIPDFGSGDLLVGTPICYELLFPNLVRGFSKHGASFLTALTNDAWYGMTGAPGQFLAITTLRAVETGTWTIRAANTGFSALIGPDGTIASKTELFTREVLVGDIVVRRRDISPTFYTRYGDVFAGVCASFLLIFLLFVFGRGLSTGFKSPSCSSKRIGNGNRYER